jgi:hypothetical protein
LYSCSDNRNVAALVIWNEIWSHLKVELSKDHAAVITAMWNNKDENKTIEKEFAFDATNELLHLYNQPEISSNVFNALTKDLIKMGCIEDKDGKAFWLCEWVKKSYK